MRVRAKVRARMRMKKGESYSELRVKTTSTMLSWDKTHTIDIDTVDTSYVITLHAWSFNFQPVFANCSKDGSGSCYNDGSGQYEASTYLQ